MDSRDAIDTLFTVRMAIRDLERVGLRIEKLSATAERIVEIERLAIIAHGFVQGEPSRLDQIPPIFPQKMLAGIPLTVRDP